MNDAVKVHKRGAVLEITLDRPKANAIDVRTSVAMGEAFVDFRDDPSLRVAILTGGGEKFFSAGWDLKAATEGEAYDADYGPRGRSGWAPEKSPDQGPLPPIGVARRHRPDQKAPPL